MEIGKELLRGEDGGWSKSPKKGMLTELDINQELHKGGCITPINYSNIAPMNFMNTEPDYENFKCYLYILIFHKTL